MKNVEVEIQVIIKKPEEAEKRLKEIGSFVEEKKQTDKYFDCGNFEVTLDNVEGLGDFMEVEAKKDFGGIDKSRKACEDFLNNLNIEHEIKKDQGYPRMLYKKLNKT